MKKTKLLTSLAALALVLSVGACTEPTEETTSEDTGVVETTTETETTTEDTSEDGTTSESTSEDNTSEDTSEGNTSEDTSEDNTSESTSEDNTSESTSEDNTSEDTSEDDTSGNTGKEDDATIAQAILDNILGKTPNWTAFYGYAEDDYFGELTSYLAIDEDGNLFGYKDADDFDDETYTYYFYNGYRCMYNVNGEAQEPKEITTTFEDELSIFTYGLTLSFDLSSDPYTLEEVDRGYELTVAKSTSPVNTYTFTVDASYNLLVIDRDTAIGSQPDYIESSYVEGIDLEDVEEALEATSFDPADFGLGEDDGLAHNPAELMEKIYNENNYHLTLYYDVYETAEDYRITYGDYLANSTYYWYYLQTYLSAEYYAYDIYYMENALLVEEYKYNGYYYAQTGYEAIYYDYGEGNSVYRWTTSNGYSYSGSYWDAQYRLYDIAYSLMLAYSYYGVQNGFTYTGSGTDYYGDACDFYNLDSTSALYLFVCLGTEFIFGSQNAAINAAYSFDFDEAYFYEDSQSMEVDYWTYGLYTDDATATSDSIVYFGEYIVEAVIDDVGTTTDNGYCQYMSNYFLGIS